MSKSVYRRASQSRPLLGNSVERTQSPCSRQRMRIFVSARLQATAAPEAPEPMIRTSTLSFMPASSAPLDEELLVDTVFEAPIAQIACRRARGEAAIVAHALRCVKRRVRRQD